MTPAELRANAIARYGPHNWKARLAADIGVTKRTVQRWAKGSHTIPAPTAMAIEGLNRD
jgi:DNA-binding transcriptional regulator YdaS (Cro superfamily)